MRLAKSVFAPYRCLESRSGVRQNRPLQLFWSILKTVQSACKVTADATAPQILEFMLSCTTNRGSEPELR